MIYDDESQYTKEPLSTCFCLTCMTPGPGDKWKMTKMKKTRDDFFYEETEHINIQPK